MSKKFVRGITDIKTISKQDFDTNNVNDLLSDGQYNYIHRKKGKTEEYHNLTDNIKTISSSNTDLIEVDNNNTTNNTATLHPKHDAQKEQVLESERNTITINHGSNGTPEKTKVDTNPEKVLEHGNLQTTYGISKETAGNTTTLGIECTRVNDGYDLNNLLNGRVVGYKSTNAPTSNNWYLVESFSEGSNTIQRATSMDSKNISYLRFKSNNDWGVWITQVGDKSVIDGLLAQKQNTLTAMGGISIAGNNISLLALDDYSEDLNNLTYSCRAKPIDNAPNLPTGVGGNGILTVNRVGYVVSQTYHALDNNIYYRITNNSSSSFIWTPWVKVETTALS